MKNIIKYVGWLGLFFSSSLGYAWHWEDVWRTSDQKAAHLLRTGNPKQAAQTFVNQDWRAVASYRANDYAHAYHYFSSKHTSDGQYNAGNAAAFLGHYKAALDAYDKAIALNPKNKDAIFNRDIVKKLAEKNKDSQKNSSNKNNNDGNEKNQRSESKQSKQQQSNQQSASQQSSHSKNEKDHAEKTSATDHSSTKDEDKKQLLRRLADDPGGLLRQKFLRDYFHRHAGENSSQEAG